ncbi:uncharacterized protein BJX67DRAFT_382186 [Aspergillus lucknowensis]|uniref:GAR domain-containing protein n=1 Tax=Aspergillus lucknowensis TaxID=176173 RepID=A0ABR4LNG9_9EURO
MSSLKIERTIAAALVQFPSLLILRPRYIIAQGGMTSSDAARKGLRMCRARILGQAAPGVSLSRCDLEVYWHSIRRLPSNVGEVDTRAVMSLDGEREATHGIPTTRQELAESLQDDPRLHDLRQPQDQHLDTANTKSNALFEVIVCDSRRNTARVLHPTRGGRQPDQTALPCPGDDLEFPPEHGSQRQRPREPDGSQPEEHLSRGRGRPGTS